jgi:hypothetical protein
VYVSNIIIYYDLDEIPNFIHLNQCRVTDGPLCRSNKSRQRLATSLSFLFIGVFFDGWNHRTQKFVIILTMLGMTLMKLHFRISTYKNPCMDLLNLKSACF